MARFRPSYDRLYVEEGSTALHYTKAGDADGTRLEGPLWKRKEANTLKGKPERWKLKWVLATATHVHYYTTDDQPAHGDHARKRIPLHLLELRHGAGPDAGRPGISLYCADQRYDLRLGCSNQLEHGVWWDFLEKAIANAEHRRYYQETPSSPI